jgi:hypothetical protein
MRLCGTNCCVQKKPKLRHHLLRYLIAISSNRSANPISNWGMLTAGRQSHSDHNIIPSSSSVFSVAIAFRFRPSAVVCPIRYLLRGRLLPYYTRMLFCSLNMTSSSLVMIGLVGDEIWPKAAGGMCARAAMVRVYFILCPTVYYTEIHP